jgi:integral membrane sensor domain MASE1
LDIVNILRFSPQWRLWGYGQRGLVREHSSHPAFRFVRPLAVLLVAISYYLGTKVGFLLTPVQTPIATFWPPNAILLGAFLLSPKRLWWALVLAVLPAHLLVQLQAGVPVVRTLGWFVGNTGEALLGAACIRYFNEENDSLLESPRGVISFLVFGVLLAPLVTSFWDAATVVLTDRSSDYWMLWTTRLSSNMIATLTLVPTILLFGLNGFSWIRKVTLARWVEACVLAFGILFVSILVFDIHNAAADTASLLIFAPLPLLLWASVRFGPAGLSASILVVSLISVWNAMHGRGPFAWSPMAEDVLFLHFSQVAFALPLMAVAALVQELTLLSIGLDQLRTEPDLSVKPQLDKLYDHASGVTKATRDLSHELHHFGLQYVGLQRALRTLCGKTSARASIEISFVDENMTRPLAADVQVCLYRVAQEALQNIVKHSRARTAYVRLSIRDERVLLQIVDDGVGLSPERQAEGMGLVSMRERVMALDGTFKITSAPMQGTRIETSVPFNES